MSDGVTREGPGAADLSSTRRWNPLTNEWVLVSPGRTRRPWKGEAQSAQESPSTPFDAECHLCPGNTRASGTVNANYEGVYVFANDFPALHPQPPVAPIAAGEPRFIREQATSGECHVMCYSRDHSAHLGRLSTAQVVAVIDEWAARTESLLDSHDWVQIFENRGVAMGASSPHPHCQIWATSHVPTLAAAERDGQALYHQDVGRSLLHDYCGYELADGRRVVIETEHWAAVVPFWAVWPFELLLMPKERFGRLYDIDHACRVSLAEALKQIVAVYDRVFDVPFPYSFGWHSAPAGDSPGWQLHAHFMPPLLRSATVRKHMVGFELLAEPQRDLTPEAAAEILRAHG